jgi:hypothetical protein
MSPPLAIPVLFFLLIPVCVSEPVSTPTAASRPAADTTSSKPSSAISGLLHLRVKRRPVEGASSIQVTVKNVQVQKAGAPEGSDWFTIIKEEKTFDLVASEQGEQVLGSKMLPEGLYARVQLDVVSVKVGLKGKEKPAKVASKRLNQVRPFDIDVARVCILTMDFDAAKSLVIADNEDIRFRPVVRLLVRRELPG